jgi:hypothetical protein
MGDGVNIATELRRDAGSLPVVHVRQIPDGYVDPVLELGPRRRDPADFDQGRFVEVMAWGLLCHRFLISRLLRRSKLIP